MRKIASWLEYLKIEITKNFKHTIKIALTKKLRIIETDSMF